MTDFTIPGFHRRYVLMPMLAAIALVVCAFLVTEARRAETMNSAVQIRDAQERMRLLADLAYAASDAESGQRGYLLTHEPEYLQPYNEAKQRIATLLPELHTAYANNTQETPHIERISTLIEKKLTELNSSLELSESTGTTAMSVQLVKTGVGLRWMSQVREEVEGIRNRERDNIYLGIRKWEQQHSISRYIDGGGALLNVLLLLVAGVYITRDIERRTAAVNELDKLVAQRTTELSELSTHLLRVTEREKSRLARELHDELGGLLVAIKMDLAQLAKKMDVNAADIQPRWQRIQSAISAGVDLKRRVIEELRPTLLDNMGLIAALQWQAEQTCSQAGVALQLSMPGEEPTLDTHASIAIFRVAQETFTNMVKHARATAAKLTLQITEHELILTIEDNGIGIAAEQRNKSGSHGLLSMKHRMHAIGGSFYVGPAVPKGTRSVVRVPMNAAKMALSA
ncbi:MAG: CHASE3 domain-containing protein [Steroidobacteraceae bacterium]